MSDYWTAYRARLERNHNDLVELAKAVHRIDSSVEVYHHHDRLISSLTFFRGEEINHVSFHEVPYRWSGCRFYEEHGRCHNGGENCSMPFDANDVLTTFKPVNTVRKSQVEMFKTKEQYLKWYSFLIPINYEETKSI